jgi:hypothetical protein
VVDEAAPAAGLPREQAGLPVRRRPRAVAAA